MYGFDRMAATGSIAGGAAGTEGTSSPAESVPEGSLTVGHQTRLYHG